MQPIRPNAGLRTKYQRVLEEAVSEMDKSLRYWLTAAYRKEADRIALDASPAAILAAAFRKLARRWQRRFDKLAPELAEYFATAACDRSDAAMMAALRKAGFTVRFRMTAAQRDAVQAVIQENVSLIKSVASQHLAQVEGTVMRSIAAGRDLHTLAADLEKTHGVTKRRAAFIARDQNNKATAVLTRTRQIELGATQARWLHSAGGKTPRPEHVAFSGHLYDVRKGAYLEGKWVWPGSEPNCRCVSVPVFNLQKQVK